MTIVSKIGKKPIMIPAGVDIKVDAGLVTVKGSKGELRKNVSKDLNIAITDKEIRITPETGDKASSENIKPIWGLTSALIRNMIKGVSDGFEEVLEFQGVGYKATLKGNDLELGLGFSHPISIKAPEGIAFKADKGSIRISGIDKELVGKVAAEIRSMRKPEPYKGSGIRYQGEVVRRKAGKKAAATG